MAKYSLEIIEGQDDKGTDFTAFLVCNPKQREDIKSVKGGKGSLDLSNALVIHTEIGHNIDTKLKNDIVEYFLTNFPHEEDAQTPIVGETSSLIESS